MYGEQYDAVMLLQQLNTFVYTPQRINITKKNEKPKEKNTNWETCEFDWENKKTNEIIS